MAGPMGGTSPAAIGDAVASNSGAVSAGNSSTDTLASGATFTGTWQDAITCPSVMVAVSTDQNGTYTIEFSPDGVNQDSTLTRYYRTTHIEAPHRFTVTRRYCRVTFTNTSASGQTYFRLQTIFGDRQDLNAPLDSTLAQDFDALPTRPTDYPTEVGLGQRQGHVLWNKFGYNAAVGTSAEVVASWGGTYTPMTTARTLSVVSTDAADDGDPAGTGANSVIIYGVDANRHEQTVTVTLNGTTPVVTAETWLGVNRIVIALAGSGQVNAGTITATATTDLTIQGQVPAGEGTSQQCIFHIQESHRALASWLTLSTVRFGSGTEPVVTLKGWVYSAVSNSKYEVVRMTTDLGVETHVELEPPYPFPIGESSVFWLEAVSTRAATDVACRFSLVEHRDADSTV